MSRAAGRNLSRPSGGWATPLNKQIRKKKRGLDNALSRQILFQYLLSLLAYCIGLPLICLLGVMIVSSRTWYGTELIYPFLDWVRNYFQLLFLIALIVGLLFITVYFIRKPLRFIDNLVEASQQLAREPTRPIELPELLSPSPTGSTRCGRTLFAARPPCGKPSREKTTSSYILRMTLRRL